MDFANTLALSLGTTAASIMTDCEKFGMAYGCQLDCPQLERGECEIYSSIDEMEKERANERNSGKGTSRYP